MTSDSWKPGFMYIIIHVHICTRERSRDGEVCFCCLLAMTKTVCFNKMLHKSARVVLEASNSYTQNIPFPMTQTQKDTRGSEIMTNGSPVCLFDKSHDHGHRQIACEGSWIMDRSYPLPSNLFRGHCQVWFINLDAQDTLTSCDSTSLSVGAQRIMGATEKPKEVKQTTWQNALCLSARSSRGRLI